jgi:hypothetical protein
MTPEDSYAIFRSYLKARERTLRSLTMPDAAALMFQFYTEVRPTGTSPKIRDGIGFAYGITHRRHGSPYELSLVRLFTTSDDSPGPNGSRLRLSLGYNWLGAVSWFNQPDRGLPHGNSRYAWDSASAMSLLDELRSHVVYQVLEQRVPRSVELRHEPKWDLWA